MHKDTWLQEVLSNGRMMSEVKWEEAGKDEDTKDKDSN